MPSFRELSGNLKHSDPTAHVAVAGSLSVDPDTLKVYVHDGVTPGGSEVGGGSGMVRLASGTISTPIEFLDLALPTGYSSFRLLFTGFYLDTPDNLVCSFSADNGVTFYCDPVNVDTWDLAAVGWTVNGGNNGRAHLAATQFVQFNNTTSSASVLGTVDADTLIIPGSMSQGVRAQISSTTIQPNFTIETQLASFSLAQSATIPPVLTRVNLIRIAPWGSGDINPPTSGEKIAGGTYRLWGIE